MSVQRGELQIISVDRKSDVYQGRQPSVRLYRRRKKKIRQGICCSLIVICLLMFLGISYETNWFTDLPAAGGEQTQIRRLKEEIAEENDEEEYPKEFAELLEQNEETYDFVKNYPHRADYIGMDIDLSEDCKAGSVPLLMQWDKRWGYDLYGDAMIGISGCGPTCMAMAYLYFKNDPDMNPREMAEFAQNRGYHTEDGTSWSFWTQGAKELGLYGEEVSLNENAMKTVLDCGGLLVCSMAPGDFTTGGHFILLKGYDENGFYVNDPNRKSNSEKQWDYETLSRQIKNLWGIYE